MKLLNHTSSYFSIILLIIIPLWAGLFYFAMLEEIYDSMDDGLGNQKLLIIRKAVLQPELLTKKDFDEGNYAIQPVTFNQAKDKVDVYLDTMMFMQNENDFEPVRMLKTVFKHGNQHYSMKVITSMVEEDDLIFELLTALIWLYLGLMITIVVLNNLLLKNVWRPFNLLLDQLGRFRLEDAKPLKYSRTPVDEFNALHSAVDGMFKSSVKAYQNQKIFIENASHELQTPLAMTINKLELLSETEELTSDQLTLVSSALDSLTRLKRLNHSLLLLSQIDNQQYATIEPVNMNELTKQLVEEFSALNTYKSLTVTFQDLGPCIWNVNPDLASILISNLIKNASSHNVIGGLINITINHGFIELRNSGKEQSLDESKIFDRFYKGDGTEQSTGLGLAIVKAICDNYNISLTYSFETEHIFKLSQ